MATDNDFKYGLYVMNPDFTEHNHVFLKDERDRMWYGLTFK